MAANRQNEITLPWSYATRTHSACRPSRAHLLVRRVFHATGYVSRGRAVNTRYSPKHLRRRRRASRSSSVGSFPRVGRSLRAIDRLWIGRAPFPCPRSTRWRTRTIHSAPGTFSRPSSGCNASSPRAWARERPRAELKSFLSACIASRCEAGTANARVVTYRLKERSVAIGFSWRLMLLRGSPARSGR